MGLENRIGLENKIGLENRIGLENSKKTAVNSGRQKIVETRRTEG